MRNIILISLVVLFINLYSQNNWVNHTYKCYGNNTTISLPADFGSPKFFEYEEGSISSFSTLDTCVVSILCGNAGNMSLDSTYQVIEEKDLGNGKKRVDLYSEKWHKYARKDNLIHKIVMYDGATKEMKLELDKLFDWMDMF